jgi:exodeoxyribonuclease VII large subunit
LAQRLDDFSFRVEAAMSSQFRQRRREVSELAAAVLRHDPRQGLAKARERLATCRARTDRSLERTLNRSAARLSALEARLHSLSPLAVLDRGYALVLDAQGGVVRSIAHVSAGDDLVTRLCDGTFTSRVKATTHNKKTEK